MDGVFVDEFDDVFIAEVFGDEMNVLRYTFRRVVLVLEESESGPLRMFFPKCENGFGSLQSAPSGKVENGVLAAGNLRIVEVA